MLPTPRVVMPSAIACSANGELEANELTPVGFGAQLETTAARSWAALWVAAQTFDLALTWTYGGAYRTLAQQTDLFHRRWQSTPVQHGESCWFDGGQWWRVPGTARAAVPGTSNHGWGLALDVAQGDQPAHAVSLDGAAMGWLLVHAGLYGFGWESQDEPWHIRYVAGDLIPVATVQTEAWFANDGR